MALNQQLPNGPWLATITLTSGTTTRTAQATLTFPNQPGTGPAVPAHTPTQLTWWLIGDGTLAVLALLVIGILAVYLTRRRYNLNPRRPADARELTKGQP